MVASGFEVLGIGLVIPIVTALLGAGLAGSGDAVSRWLPNGGGLPAHDLVLALAAIVAVFTLKALYLAWLGAQQAAFSWAINRSLSVRLYEGYLGQPWAFHLRRNSADLIRNTLTEVHQITASALALQQLLLDGLTLLVIALLLLWVEPIGAGVGLVFASGMAWLLHRSTLRRLARWGSERQQLEGSRLRHATESLAAAREIRVLGVAPEFVARFRQMTDACAIAGEHRSSLQQWPRLWMEWTAVTGMAAMIAAMAVGGRPPEQMLLALALFGVAAFRLLPVSSRILASLQTLRYGQAALRVVHEDLLLVASPTGEARTDQGTLTISRSLRFDRVSFRHPGSDRDALRSICLEIPHGCVSGIFGHSGAGKSTLVDLLLGLLSPDTGRITVDDVDLAPVLPAWQKQIGYVPQHISLLDDSLRRNIAIGIADSEIDDPSLERAVRLAQLDHVVARLSEGVDTVIGERGVRLSGGECQRIGLARALYRRPALLVLDEATSALDPATEAAVMQALRGEGGIATIVLVAHRASTLRHCDRLIQLDMGRVAGEGNHESMATTLPPEEPPQRNDG